VVQQKKHYFNVYESNNNIVYQYIKNEADATKGLDTQAHLNLGVSAPSTTNAIILCDTNGCEIKDPFNDKTNLDSVVYLKKLAETAQENNLIIKCVRSNGCKQSTQSEEGYFLTTGSKPLIVCTKNNNILTCKLGEAGTKAQYYINALSDKSIIYCTDKSSCDLYTPPVNSYFLNQDGTSSDSKKALINCYSKTCQLQEEVINNGYYLTVDRI